MRSETAQLYLAPDADKERVERNLHALAASVPGLRHMRIGRNLEGSWGAGDYTVDLLCETDAPPAADRLTQLAGVSRVDRAAYRRLGGGQRAANMQNGIWRTLMLCVRPEASAEQVTALERELLQMPHYMPGIRNWRLSRVTSNDRWTHVWQQEFERVDDLMGEYLMHPYHWGWVDRWFDPEFPEWIVTSISHAFCPLASSILSLDTHSKEAT
ncbi:Dabb family protein [Herbaspirillum sp. GCM10030257]|uniref:Dabb family protein n=1 Tax=Herbaspirillum sp. GCM10030257 TaxID=3273393 RepID=UPI0036170549